MELQKAQTALKDARSGKLKDTSACLGADTGGYLRNKLRNDDGLLLHAAKHGKLENVRELIAKGANVNVKDNEGKTPLVRAVTNQHKAVVKALLELKANVDQGDRAGVTPLMFASKMGSVEIVQLLLDGGANVNKTDNDLQTALMKTLNVHVASRLIKKGANVNAQDRDGGTALMEAVSFDKFKLAELLVKAGADVNVMNSSKVTPYVKAVTIKAAKYKHSAKDYETPMMKLLRAHGASTADPGRT